MDKELFVILNLGGRYRDTIARRIREFSAYSEVLPVDTPAEKIQKLNPKGIILTGHTSLVFDNNGVLPDKNIYSLGIPILAASGGAFVMAAQLGGIVKSRPSAAAVTSEVTIDPDCPIFADLEPNQPVYINPYMRIETLPPDFRRIASAADRPNAAIANDELKLYGTEFILEADETTAGRRILERFIFRTCGAAGDFTLDKYLKNQVKSIKKQVGKEKVLLALSGGVDSSVVAAILSAAVPNQLTCIFVDHGLMRKDEGDEIEEVFRGKSLKLIRVDASERFFKKLSGVTDPEKKRKIIGEQFIKVFYKQAERLGGAKYLAQGTIYPDVIESGIGKNNLIKSHHNVGGLPKELGFKDLIEPLRFLFKDEVRKLGRIMGLPDTIIERQPFPGPGLAIRILGEVTRNKVELLRKADAIFRAEIEAAGVNANQYFAVLSNAQAVGIANESRSYNNTIILRAVSSVDFMKADYVPIPHEVLRKVSRRITNEVEGVNRVVYDITDKPPATIEWE